MPIDTVKATRSSENNDFSVTVRRMYSGTALVTVTDTCSVTRLVIVSVIVVGGRVVVIVVVVVEVVVFVTVFVIVVGG